ncbi:1-aminocyclopropane-1-carboxylate oxidase [Asimina triloba]
MAVPVFDFSKLNGEERAQTMAQIAKACEEWGFFQLINHGIPVELLERVKKVCSQCYKQGREEAFKDSAPVHALNEVLESNNGSCRLDDVDWEDIFLLHDHNDWPSQPAEFKETMMEYRRELKKLAEKVMEVMDENLGLEKGYIKSAFAGGEAAALEPFFGTKVSHYPPCPHPDRVNGLRAHTDAGGVILLFQDDKVKGLQILKNGTWIDVQPMPHAIVINTGDQIEVLSNGQYKSVWHRVLATPNGTRRSIASFYNPSLKAAIEPAPQLVQDERAAYPKFLFGNYMSIYADQKFLPKEPRFEAASVMNCDDRS